MLRNLIKLAAVAAAAAIAMATGVLPSAWHAASTALAAESHSFVNVLSGTQAAATSGTPANATSFAYGTLNDDGTPVTWGTCAPIDVVVNLAGAPEGALADVQDALAQISAASGLSFTYAGLSDAVPTADWGKTATGWAPVLVAWVTPDSGLLDAATAGRTTNVFTEGRYVSGLVLFNTSLDAGRAAGFGQAGSRGAIYLHEFAHLAGLGHVEDAGQVMHPNVPFAGELEAGDLAGLATLAPDCAAK